MAHSITLWRENSLKKILRFAQYTAWILVFCLIVGFAFSANAQTTTMLSASSAVPEAILLRLQDQQQIIVGRSMQLLTDSTSSRTLADVMQPSCAGRWQNTTENVPNLGFVNNVVWARFMVQNSNPLASDWLIEISYPPLDSIHIFIVESTTVLHSELVGDHIPISQRRFKHRFYVVPLTLSDTMPKMVYIRVRTESSMQFPITLYRMTEFTQETVVGESIFGLFYGLIFALLVYNAFVAFSLKSRTYWLYVAYVSLSFLYFGALNGHANRYVIGDWVRLSNTLLPVLLAISNAAFLFFANSLLQTKIYLPKAQRVLQFGGYYFLALGFLALFVKYRFSIIPIGLSPMFSISSTFIIAIITWRAGNTSARYFVLAGMFFMLGSFLNTLRAYAFIPSNAITSHSFEAGFAAEALLFAFALTNRYGILREEKKFAQQEALRIQREANEQLERKVRERTEELERSNEEIYRHIRVLDEQAAEIELANVTLQEKNTQLEQLNMEKNEFLGIAAHDLKNPLAHIIMSTGTVVRYFERMKRSDIISSLESIGEVARRMSEIISNLLDVNAIEQGGIKLHCASFDLVPKTASVVQDYRERAASKGVHIQFDASDKAIVFADEQAMMQVLDNIVSNAIKYSPHGKRVFVRVTSTEEAVTRVEVQDEGQGISPDDMKKLFGKFARLSARPTGGEHSTGLGLSIVKKMVEAMNGRVWCKSELGLGATFIVELPSSLV
jgi:two-component system, sensor histidine kinase LadS